MRAQTRLDGDLRSGFTALNTKLDAHDRRHDEAATRAQERHEKLIIELHEHSEEDERRFGELQGLVRNRSTLGGIGIVISAVLAAMGIKVGGS